MLGNGKKSRVAKGLKSYTTLNGECCVVNACSCFFPHLNATFFLEISVRGVATVIKSLTNLL